MLKRQNRLSTNFEFNVVKKYGCHVEGNLIHLNYLKPKNYVGPCKVGIVVSNKFEKTAVKRNRVKRLIREAVQGNIGLIPENYWVVINPKNRILEVRYEEICTEIAKILQEISLTN